jgi:hypothetical protein
MVGYLTTDVSAERRTPQPNDAGRSTRQIPIGIDVCVKPLRGCWARPRLATCHRVEAYPSCVAPAFARDVARGQTRAVTREHERCEACGFDGEIYTDSALLEALRSLHDRWRQQLATAGAELRIRPAPDTWSAIEYAAHSRDITALHAYGVEQALTQDEPIFPPIGDDLADAAAVTYADADSDEVLQALGDAAERLVRLADHSGMDAWARGLTVGDSRSDVRRLLEHALHDSEHHLGDVERGLATVRAD